MADPETVIRVESLGKKYQLAHREEGPRYEALRDVLVHAGRNLARRLRHPFQAHHGTASREEFWALKDVSFDVKRGEVVGIIGRNGAGKSTLLKILSRITEPTAGRVTLHGRVASLLEVGTGFHPELTGRENIYLNGAILGMSRAETYCKFDEIVAFAEIEKFLDTPVKRYSSGMYMRLAFAVASHLDAEILLVDEVLAVGDARFQEKCLGKMQQTTSRGRTVLFVSHNMAAIQQLCPRTLLLNAGYVEADADSGAVIKLYYSDAYDSASVDLADWGDRITNGQARITGLQITDEAGRPTNVIKTGDCLRVTIEARFANPEMNPAFGVLISASTGEPLLDLRSKHSGLHVGQVTGDITATVSIAALGVYPGTYLLSPWITDDACQYNIDFPRNCCTLKVTPNPAIQGCQELDPHWGKYWVPSVWMVTENGTCKAHPD